MYESRFGQVPPEIAETIGGMLDAATLRRWTTLVATASRDAVDAPLRAERRAR